MALGVEHTRDRQVEEGLMVICTHHSRVCKAFVPHRCVLQRLLPVPVFVLQNGGALAGNPED